MHNLTGQGRGRKRQMKCKQCGKKFFPRRRHAQTCSAKCRYDLYLDRRQGAKALIDFGKKVKLVTMPKSPAAKEKGGAK